MLKNSVLAMLIACMLLTAACSRPNTDPTEWNRSNEPFGKYEHPVKISVGMGVDPNYKSYKGETPANNPWVRAIKEELNVDVKVDWFVSNQNFDQKVDLAIASNTLPDALVVSHNQLVEMVKADELADLTEVYEQFASPVMKSIIDSTNGKAKEHVTFKGKMLALPSVDAEDISMMWIRKDWLDKLGLEPPRTLEELEKTAVAFVEQDPDGNGRKDTIGIAASAVLYDDFFAGPGAFNLDPIFSAHHAYPGFWIEGENGKPTYGSIQPEMKEALALLRKWYEQGLIDQELGIRETAEEVIINGKAGIFFAPFYGGYWPLPDAWMNNPRANWQAYALPLDSNSLFHAKVFHHSKSFVVVRKGYPNPEVAIKIANLILRDEHKYGVDFQPLRQSLSPRDEISYSAQAIIDVLAGNRKPEDFADQEQYKLLYHDLKSLLDTKLAPYDKMDIRYWNTRADNFKRTYSLLVGGRNLLDPNLVKVASAYYSSTETIDKNWSRLRSMEMDFFTQVVMGVAPLDAFDEWVLEWKKQGGDQITYEVMQGMETK